MHLIDIWRRNDFDDFDKSTNTGKKAKFSLYKFPVV